MKRSIEIRGTVREINTVGIHIEPLPVSDGDDSIGPVDGLGRVAVYFADAQNEREVASVARTFGAAFGVEGAVKITVEIADPPRRRKRKAAALRAGEGSGS